MGQPSQVRPRPHALVLPVVARPRARPGAAGGANGSPVGPGGGAGPRARVRGGAGGTSQGAGPQARLRRPGPVQQLRAGSACGSHAPHIRWTGAAAHRRCLRASRYVHWHDMSTRMPSPGAGPPAQSAPAPPGTPTAGEAASSARRSRRGARRTARWGRTARRRRFCVRRRPWRRGGSGEGIGREEVERKWRRDRKRGSREEVGGGEEERGRGGEGRGERGGGAGRERV